MTRPVNATSSIHQPDDAATSAALTLAALRARMEDLYALRDLSLPALSLPGVANPMVITLPADPDAPLDQFSAALDGRATVDKLEDAALPETMAIRETSAAAEQARAAVAAGTHLPYWGLLWPSGQALAETIVAERAAFTGKRALELGCGLGLTAAVALAAGVRLQAADCFTEALLFTRYNTLRLAGETPDLLLLDWRTPEGQIACRAGGPFDLLLAADVLYEQEDVAPLLELAPSLLAPDGVFWLAEPGRRVSRGFVAAAREAGWRDEERVYERAWPPDDDVVRVVVHRLTPPSQQ